MVRWGFKFMSVAYCPIIICWQDWSNGQTCPDNSTRHWIVFVLLLKINSASINFMAFLKKKKPSPRKGNAKGKMVACRSLTNSLKRREAKCNGEGILPTPFWCLCQKISLSSLHFNKTLLHKSSERSILISGPGLNSSPPEAKNPGIFAWFSNNLSSWGLVWDPLGQDGS